MCGIVGVYRYKTRQPVLHHQIEQMNNTIEYRGPDGAGVHVDRCFGVGHRRLSILDTHTRSSQPMLDSSERYVLAYNGEVYNYLELKENLHAKGISFRTESDTEVLLYSMIHEPSSALTQFNGMYAFALWDSHEQQLTLVRDRMGIKPLYYVETSEGIAFASEMKSLLVLPEVNVQFDPALIDAYMSVGYCPGETTLIKSIKKLQPGHTLVVKGNSYEIKKYWDVSYPSEKTIEDLGEAHYLKELDEIFESSVAWQLRSDVPLGVFLSGGVDSSAVVYMMNRLKQQNIKTFSVRWDFGDKFDESQYARQISKQFNTEHHEYTMTPQDFSGFVPDYVKLMDEPVTEAAAISLYFIAKETKKHVTVVLSGEGADEVFGGYPIYRYMDYVDRFRGLPGLVRKPIQMMLNQMGGKFRKWSDLSSRPLSSRYFGVSVYDQILKDELYNESFRNFAHNHHVSSHFKPLYDQVAGCSTQQQMQYVDYKTWLLDDLLTKADRMSMAASLELRVPFLDHRFIEFATRLPVKYRTKNNESKYLLKKALEPHLPHEVLYRKKMGFPTPLARLFAGPLQEYMRDILSSHQCQQRGYFNPQVINRIIDEHVNGKADHHRVLWQLVVLELWQQTYID
ncbi:MAG TPA: asparagine synthase (glutamine-hydrolyzing) [Gammaproteobacteria bacterium]|nr:asparagine synthase (glutamine-hydrolyzing) [Gammaproteobacteria bacterium]HBF07619.1 asparagine synthase (glutamine-hydrolyzing) [Gammaproteobacteria bacterium]HCK91672.1 asparagine synthase (glutamine-hydrolyzing) [Gammaproteobacteria bacterium]|tara:strand:- start:10689 stop:12557 length:1869 start_codon:yes stop_codon:yes gene_type:complete